VFVENVREIEEKEASVCESGERERREKSEGSS